MATLDELVELRSRLEDVRGRAVSTRQRSMQLCDESFRLRFGVAQEEKAEFPRWFVVRGSIEGQPVQARWWGGLRNVDQALLTRSELIVELGDEFESPDGSSIRANLGEPLAALLTLVRACDAAEWVAFGQTPSPPEGASDLIG